MNSYYLGIDAGGTKTIARIVDEQGQILGEGDGGGANPHNQELEKVLSHIGLAVLTAKKTAEGRLSPGQEIINFVGTCIGMAGLDTDDDRVKIISGIKAGMLSKWSANGLLLVNDGMIGLRSGVEENYGICVISGTGSNVYGITKDGLRHAQAGDWGWMLGDEGSGFAMGRKLLLQVMKEYDGRTQRTVLVDKLLAYLNLSDVLELMRWMYREEVPVRDIADLTKLLADEEISQLPLVLQLVSEAVWAQVVACQAVVKKLNLTGEFSVVLSGGLMNLTAIGFPDQLAQGIKQSQPHTKIIRQTQPPVAGAIALAKEIETHREETFYKQFLVEW